MEKQEVYGSNVGKEMKKMLNIEENKNMVYTKKKKRKLESQYN